MLISIIKPTTCKQCWLQYKELYSWVLLVFILILHFKKPFINYSALAPELSMCMLFFAYIAVQPSGDEGRHRECAEHVWLPAPHTQICVHIHSPSDEIAEQPFTGSGYNSLHSLLPRMSCNVWSLKPNPSCKQLRECQHQEFFDMQHKWNAA